MSNHLLRYYIFIGLITRNVICGSINQPVGVQKNADTQVPLQPTADSSRSFMNSNLATDAKVTVYTPSNTDLLLRLPNATSKSFGNDYQQKGFYKVLEKRLDKPPTASTPEGKTVGYIRNDGTYVINDGDGIPCILAFFRSKITVYFAITKDRKTYDSVRVSPPRDVSVEGSCDRKNRMAILRLTWNEGILCLEFGFDDITDSWYVGQFSFTYDTAYKRYKGSVEDKTVILKSLPSRRFWATSHARSFRCLLLHDVNLVDDDEKHTGTIHFDEARVQALTRTANFKTPKHCIHRVHRNEMVPATVGGIMAAVIVLTITGYAVFRYFKVKKFQYGTME